MLRRSLNRLRYFLSDAWDECRHSSAVNLMALATLASVLFVAGLVVLILSNVDRRIEGLRGELRVNVYLSDDHDEEQRRSLTEALRAIDGVASVDYVDKSQALERYRHWAAEMAELVNELDSNPLPASLEVRLDPSAASLDTASRIAARLANRPGVEEVRFSQDWLERLETMVQTARVGGSVLAVLVFAAVVFVMASVLRLAVYARRDEITIMQLVGASPAFIRGPFLVAGAVHGVLASLLALAVVEGVRRAALTYGGARASLLLDLVAAHPLSPGLCGLLLLVGLAVSLASSYFAVRLSRG